MISPASLALLGSLTMAAPPPPAVPQVNAALQDHWKAVGVAPVGPADDLTFLRRASLDLAGATPSADEVQAFVADKGANKRARLVDTLLAGDDFADHWAADWARQLLGGRRPIRQDKYDGRVLRDYLRDAVKADKSYKTVVTELITGEGAMDASGPANFLLRYEAKPTDLAGAVFKNFQGVSLQCAQCHNHPFTQWKKDDFWGVAAFFGRLRLVEDGDGADYISAVLETRRGDLQVPDPTAKPDENGNQPMKAIKPRMPGAPADAPAPARRRAALAAWITADDNPYFAVQAVNQTWTRLLGAGLLPAVDGVDKGSASKLTAAAALLAADFKASGYDLKRLVRTVVLSRTYQLSSGAAGLAKTDKAAETADLQARNFARFPIRPLSVDQLYLSIAKATGYKGDEPPPSPPAPDGQNPPPATPPADAPAQAPPPAADDDPYPPDQPDRPADLLGERAQTVQRALVLLNGDYVQKAVQAGVHSQLKDPKRAPNAEDIDRLFLSTLSRRPTKEEGKAMLELLHGGEGAAGLEDVLWAIFNSAEFNSNH